MSSNEPLGQRPVADASHIAPAVALDGDFDARWAAWVERGHAHDQIVRRKLRILAG